MRGRGDLTRPLRSSPGRRAPLTLALPAVLAVLFLLLPLVGVLVRTSWTDLGHDLTSAESISAVKLSLVVSLLALGLSLLLGVPLAWLLARTEFPGKTLVRALVLLPMVLPPTVGGVALLLGLGRRGLLGPWLADWFGVTLPFSTSGAVVAATFVAMPFLVISLEGTLAGLPARYEETAASLGASPTRVFLTVTLPMVAPGLAAGAALTWARALGEFGATITFAGNLPGVTQTLPLKVYLLLQDDPRAATSLSLLLLAIAMAVLLLLRGRWTGTPPPRSRRPPRVAVAEAADAQPDAFPSAPPRTAVAGGGRSLRAEITGFDELVLAAEPGTTLAVVGPNGAGKSTLLRALLGMPGQARARLRLDGREVTGLPPHRRGIAWVPQHGSLFPRMNALDNTGYGLRARGVPRAQARREAARWLDRLGVGGLARRRPEQLSGGQAGRVALARALAARPDVLLLDEPLAALDQTTRGQVRGTLRRHLAGFDGVCLIVTHDPVEALSLADRVVVLERGRLVQDAPPAELARRPRSVWLARMLGHNAWTGRTTDDGVAVPGGRSLLTRHRLPPDQSVLTVVGPDAVSVLPAADGEPSGDNTWPGWLTEITPAGGQLRLLITVLGGGELIAELPAVRVAELGLAEGTAVHARVATSGVTLVPLER